ncbi:preprotein translocase subunit SecE [bacterium]|nr:preprotein translocase subunit SecE [bacterium]
MKKESSIETKSRKSSVARHKGAQKSFSTNPSNELKKVTWPNQQTLIKSTFLILVMVTLLTIFVSGADYISSKFFYLLRDMV